MTTSRMIRLRRPPTIRAVGEPFVPRGVPLDEVDRRWAALCAENAAFHDGRLLHVFGVHRNGHGGATIHVAECAYRFHAVSIDGPDTGVRPLGVKGIVTASEGDLVLLGRRSRRVAAYGGCWEFAPGGGVEPGASAEATFERELREETGLSLDDVIGPREGEPSRVPHLPSAHAILFDGAVRSWEIVLALRLERPADVPQYTDEYDALRWVPIGAVLGGEGNGALDAPLTPAALAMLPLVPRRSDAGSSITAVRTPGDGDDVQRGASEPPAKVLR